MLLNSTARTESGSYVRPRAVIVALALASLAMQPLSAHAAATKALDVLNRMQAFYTSIKTYQGTQRSVQTGKAPNGKTLTQTTTQQTKFKRPNRFYQTLTISVTGMPQGNSSITVVDDGKNIYQYSPKLKMYRKQPSPPTLPAPGQNLISQIDLQSAKLLADTQIAGRSAYVVSVMPKLPPTITPAQRATVKPLMLDIDKSNYTLLRIRQPQGSVEFSNQIFNAAIADSAFVFTPPAGAKPAPTPPMGGMPGGAPSAPGSPKR